MARPFRYTLILASVALGTVLAAAGGWRYARASAPVSGPVIIISVDTLRADHLPAYGYKKLKTPAIDALAADGVVFEHAYSHATETLPAHVSLLAGRLPFETGVRGDEAVVKRSERLLPQLLHDRGYATAAIVSTVRLGKDTGLAQGFDFFDEPESGAFRRDGVESEQIAEHWLNSAGTSRAFLFLQLYEPHRPYAEAQNYDTEIAIADEAIGRLVHYLKAHQLYDRTTIMLVSDHGEGLGDHGEQEHGLFLYTEAIHVPLIVKQESNVGAGRRIADVVQHIDIVPTILDFAKAPIPGGLRGRSLKPVLEGAGRLPERAVYSESLYAQAHFGWGALTALTDAHHQYIRAPREELYDLDRDFRERKNIAGDNPRVAADMRGALTRAGGDSTLPDITAGATAPPPDPKDKPAVVETYREAIALAGDRKWPQAIQALQGLLRADPAMTPVWRRLAGFAIRIDRHDIALDAYRHLIELRPEEPSGYLGAANADLKLRKLDEARTNAALAADMSADTDKQSLAQAHDLLARIALARHDLVTARAEAAMAHDTAAAFSTPAYIDARVLFDQGKYEDALPLFQQAGDHFYTAETLTRLYRYDEAEAEYTEELKHAPDSTRARTSLANLYHANGQPDAAEKTVSEIIQTTPTPDSYALASKLLTTFGKPRQASALRAESRRTFHP